MNRRRNYLDTLVITVPSRENNDGTVTPATDFRCEVETLPSGAKRIRSAKKITKAN